MIGFQWDAYQELERQDIYYLFQKYIQIVFLKPQEISCVHKLAYRPNENKKDVNHPIPLYDRYARG